jgi:hypothetical protein
MVPACWLARSFRRGKTGAVGADQRDDLALLHIQRYAMQRFDGAVMSVYLFKLQHHSSPR